METYFHHYLQGSCFHTDMSGNLQGQCATRPVQPTYSQRRTNDCPNLFCKSNNLTLLSLPEPVLPTMPIFSFGLMVKDTFLSTRGRFSRYRISAFSKTTSPSCGQSRGGVLFLIRAGASRESVLTKNQKFSFQ